MAETLVGEIGPGDAIDPAGHILPPAIRLRRFQEILSRRSRGAVPPLAGVAWQFSLSRGNRAGNSLAGAARQRPTRDTQLATPLIAKRAKEIRAAVRPASIRRSPKVQRVCDAPGSG
jgi:hypothetical protein